MKVKARSEGRWPRLSDQDWTEKAIQKLLERTVGLGGLATLGGFSSVSQKRTESNKQRTISLAVERK